ncbi:hypothetical protein Vi05172_g11220 [Venturia inaequalis]|nr:hypothetical protein Vi05172_g11220 [Venturia inaequalis]
MTSDSRASLAFAFYAYTPPFRCRSPTTQSLLNETSSNPNTLPQIAANAQLQASSAVNCPSYTSKRRRDDTPCGHVVKKRRNCFKLDTDWEMIDA